VEPSPAAIAKECDAKGANVAIIRHKVQLFAPRLKGDEWFLDSNPHPKCHQGGTGIKIFGL
jgi:hypothetical protein